MKYYLPAFLLITLCTSKLCAQVESNQIKKELNQFCQDTTGLQEYLEHNLDSGFLFSSDSIYFEIYDRAIYYKEELYLQPIHDFRSFFKRKTEYKIPFCHSKFKLEIKSTKLSIL